MPQLPSTECYKAVVDAARLHISGQYQAASDLLKKQLDDVNPDVRMNTFILVFKSATATNDQPLAQWAAREIAKEYPDMASIQPYL
jgi:hypothetical protein